MTDLERIIYLAKAVNELYAKNLVINITGSYKLPSVLMDNKEAFFSVIPQECLGKVNRESCEYGVFRTVELNGVLFKTLDKEEDDESV